VGFSPRHGGEDMLAKLLIEIREEAMASRAAISQSGVFDTQQNLSFALPTYNNLLSVQTPKIDRRERDEGKFLCKSQ